MKIGLALSGGGARGIAHIGVIKALEENGIFPDAVSGASAGAIIGALYASGRTPEEMMDFVKDVTLLKIFKVGLPIGGLTNLTYLKKRLSSYLAEDNFEHLQKPLFIALSNLNTGECEIRHSGQLFNVIMASCAIPLVFKPVEIDGNQYVDGGLLSNLPLAPLTEVTDFRIGVNVIPHVKTAGSNVQTLVGIATRCFELSLLANIRPSLAVCDFLIEPKRVHAFNIFQFNQYERLFEIGYKSAIEQIPQLKEKIVAMKKSRSQVI